MAYKGTPPKMTAVEYHDRVNIALSGGHGKCWEAVLTAFGIQFTPTGKSEKNVIIRQHMTRGDWKLERVNLNDEAPDGFPVTLAVFMHNHGREDGGDYMVFTAGHVLCVRSGVITDTAARSVKRRVLEAYKVMRADVGDLIAVPVQRVLKPLANPYADVITWLRSKPGRRWSQITHHMVQHHGGIDSFAMASLKPMSDTGKPFVWSKCNNDRLPSHMGPEYIGNVMVK